MVTAASPHREPSTQGKRACPQRSWTVQLCKPLRTPPAGWPFVQLPRGEYTLHERSDVHYELRVSNDFSCYFRVSEVDAMREKGVMTIEGPWP